MLSRCEYPSSSRQLKHNAKTILTKQFFLYKYGVPFEKNEFLTFLVRYV
jgi:hypothetical protein